MLNRLKETGFRIDYERFYDEVIIPAQADNNLLAKSICDIIGNCDLNNHKDVSERLYSYGLCARYGLPLDWLSQHRDEPVYEMLYRYKRQQMFINQYGQKFKAFIGEDGRIHPQYYKNTSTTGRFSARNPAAMSLDGRIMKYMSAEEGNALLSFDFVTMDFRSLAALSNDPFLKQDLSNRFFDVHRQNAGIIFGKAPEKISDDERKIGKSLGLAIVYGMTVSTLAEKLSQKTGKKVTVKDASEFINTFYSYYPVLRKYRDRLQRGLIPCRTLGGNSFSSNLSRAQKLNYPVQGTSAEGFEKAVNAVENISEYFKLCLTVHDSIYAEVPESVADEMAELIKNRLESSMTEYLGVNSFVQSNIKEIYFYRKE